MSLNDIIPRIEQANSVSSYTRVVEELSDLLVEQHQYDDLLTLKEISHITTNRFSTRETEKLLTAKKKDLKEFCKQLQSRHDDTNVVTTILHNFPLYCQNLYSSKSHEKCSIGIKEHLSGLRIENEYDLQKLMFPVITAFYPDAQTECAQDTGHHEVRKDIVICSISTTIELKCTRSHMTERLLCEEIASDIIHYKDRHLYFYIYDRARIIHNEALFRQTYENVAINNKSVRIIIYQHDDL